MLTGICAARNLALAAAGRPPVWDVWAVNVDREYLEERRSAQADDNGGRLTPRERGRAGGLAEELEDLLRAAFARYDPVALGAAVGMVVAAMFAVAAILSWARGGESQGPTLSLLASYLPQYRQTVVGTSIGVLEAGAGGFLFGALLANSINRLVRWAELSLRRRLRTGCALDPLEAPPG